MPTSSFFTRRFLPALLLLAFGLTPLSAQEGDKKKIPVAEIKLARVGFMSNDPADPHGRYKVGLWTPVYLKIKAGPQGIRPKGPNDPEPYIQVENEDNENVGTIYRTPFRMEPNEERWVMSYAKPATMSDIKVKVVIGDLEFRPLWSGAAALDLHTHQYISLGERIPDLQAALAAQSQRRQGGQGPGGVADTFPRYAGFENDANNLPEHWFGYHAVDLLILSTKDKEFLLQLGKDNDTSRERLKAIAQYVRRGGRLVIPVSARNADVLHQLLTSTVWQPPLPVVPPREGVIEAPRLNEIAAMAGGNAPAAADPRDRYALLEPAKMPTGAWEVIAASRDNQGGAKTLIARLPYGLGSITYLAFPLDEPPFTSWERKEGKNEFLKQLFTKLAPRVGTVAEPHQQQNMSDLGTDLQKTLDNFDVRVIPFGYVALFIILYIIVVGPLDFILLKYVFKRLEWTWFTFPTVVLAVSVAAYFTAYAIKGNELKINKVDVIDFDLRTNVDAKGQTKKASAHGNTFFTILSPRIQNYTVGVEPNPLFWGQNADKPASADMVSWLGRYDQNIWGGVQRGGGQSFFRKPYRYEADAVGLVDVPIPVWTTKSFHATWEMTNLAPPLQANLTYFPAGQQVQGRDVRITGTIQSSLAVDLSDAWLFYMDQAYALDGGLPKGAEIKVHFEDSHKKGLTDWLAAGKDGERPQTAQGLYNPSALLRQLQFNDRFEANNNNNARNHALRQLDLSWRLREEPVMFQREFGMREAILVARVKFVAGAAEALTADPNHPLPTNLWLGDLPGEKKTRPALAGILAQDTFVRILLPVKPKE